MSQAKIIKVPNGDAFLEIGEDYIRIGTGPDNFILLDKASINASAKSFNYQMSPDKVTYFGFLSHLSPVQGLFPVPFGPHYSLSTEPVNALLNTAINSIIISSAIGVGV
jgi:hypothetical protein